MTFPPQNSRSKESTESSNKAEKHGIDKKNFIFTGKSRSRNESPGCKKAEDVIGQCLAHPHGRVAARPPIGGRERRGKSVPQDCKEDKEEVGDQAHPPQDFLPAQNLQVLQHRNADQHTWKNKGADDGRG